jgi:23S rRNA G2069 N7-methylase RlmK/C1962 C5-methylase RlmI
VAEDAFFAAVHHAARAMRRPLRELARTRQPPDHPVTFPEGAYLKCLFATAGG